MATLKEIVRREGYVALHAQTLRFRIIKYIVLLVLATAVYGWKGASVLALVFFYLFLLAIGIHLLFRWKTNAWTRSWGPYKKIPLKY